MSQPSTNPAREYISSRTTYPLASLKAARRRQDYTRIEYTVSVEALMTYLHYSISLGCITAKSIQPHRGLAVIHDVHHIKHANERPTIPSQVRSASEYPSMGHHQVLNVRNLARIREKDRLRAAK
jgi:hypothetical protein